MNHVCPTCGQDVAGDKVLVTLDSNTLTYKGHSVKLTRGEADAALVLARAMPRPVGYDSMITQIYGANDTPNTVQKCLQVWVCHLRKKLEPLGLAIETVLSRSYCMMPIENSKGRRGGGKLTTDDVRKIRDYPGTVIETAAYFKMSRQHVYNIRRRLSWRHVA